MSDIAIRAENITKIYKLYDNPVDRLKESLHPLRRKYHRDFFALREINLEVRRGETVGILGKNGSGKSTLLKIFTGVLTPTAGSFEIHGTVSALLELGAGFNPELTGIENVYCNGTLMGYSRKSMEAKIDDILSFADIGDFVHQPVRTYSSGMFVRLAFAVQAMVNPDIFIVDEALAVGDALFQKRCYQKIEQLIANGTTLLFVSHDQEVIRSLTKRAVFLRSGRLHMQGLSSEVILEYRRHLHEEDTAYYRQEMHRMKKRTPEENSKTGPAHSGRLSFGDRDGEIIKVAVCDAQGREAPLFYSGDPMTFSVTFVLQQDMANLNVALRIRNKEGVKIYSWGTLNQDIAIWAGKATGAVFWERRFKAGEIHEVHFCCTCSLGPNFYEVQASLSAEEDRYYGMQRMLHWQDEAAFFQISMRPREYFFGGVCDMRMRSELKEDQELIEMTGTGTDGLREGL